jgi:hypothetical protein
MTKCKLPFSGKCRSWMEIVGLRFELMDGTAE